MITNTGKSIITKYLLGQTPSYASYLAVGCGAVPQSYLSYSVTNKQIVSGTPGTATLTIASHNISVNDYITVTGIGYGMDGTFKVTAITSTTVSYALTSTLTVNESVATGTGYVTKNYSNKTNLDFEMFRVPVTSRGVVVENGVSKIVLSADLPSQDRYDVSEIGLYSLGANPSAGVTDSKTLISFSTAENWEFHTFSDSTNLEIASTTIPTISSKLDTATTGVFDYFYSQTSSIRYGISGTISSISGSGPYTASITLNPISASSTFTVGQTIKATDGSPGSIGSGTVTISAINTTTGVLSVSSTATMTAGSVTNVRLSSPLSPIQITADNTIFNQAPRPLKNEKPRFSNETILIPGSMSSISTVSGNLVPSSTTNSGYNHIHLKTSDIDLTKSSSIDELRFAFSVIDRSNVTYDNVTVNMIIEFGVGDTGAAERIRFGVNQTLTANYRYFVSVKQLKDLIKTSNFAWSNVSYVKIFANATGSAGSDNYYIALDALRLENTSSYNPIYGLVGYTTILNPASDPTYATCITKEANTTNTIEFRFVMDVS